MRILKFQKNNSIEIVKSAVRVLRAGGVIIYPTETAYGLGADFLNPRAVRRVYQIKGRSYKKPLSVIVGSFKMAKVLVKFDKISLKLAKKYWPGPLTLILSSQFSNCLKIKPACLAMQSIAGRNLKFNLPAEFALAKQAGKNFKLKIENYKTLALRISSNKLATAIIRKLNRPLTATSANISGKGECYSVDEIIKQFKNKKCQPDLIINAGRLPKNKVSTIVKVVNGKMEVLRQGKILPSL